jgi:fatty acid desaturase
MGNDIAVVAGDRVVPAAIGVLEPVAPEDAAGPEAHVQAPGADLARRGQRGMVSAEWAVGIVAAVAIAGVLLAVITSGQVQDALLKFLLWVIKGFISVVE